MLIANKYVRSVPRALKQLDEPGTRHVVPIKTPDVELHRYGLDLLREVGDRILPSAQKAATRRNFQGRLIIHKDKPKEPHSYSVLWTRKQWCGRGMTETVTTPITRTVKRYPRTLLPAEGIEISLIEDQEGTRYFATEMILHENAERWVTAANVMLEIFGQCRAVHSETLCSPVFATRKVNWKFLPQGRCTWSEIRESMEEILRSESRTSHRERAKERLGLFNSKGPTHIVIGQGGFRGYVAFCFPEYGFSILESVDFGNATYVLGEGWETLSQLTKTELISESLFLNRIIHDHCWAEVIERLFLNRAA